jgi:hypothetical protein
MWNGASSSTGSGEIQTGTPSTANPQRPQVTDPERRLARVYRADGSEAQLSGG